MNEPVNEPIMNGPHTSSIAPPPKPAGMKTTSLASPVMKGNLECAGGTGQQCSMPTSMEQLLERQWEQGSAFLIEQGQHFDSKYNTYSKNPLRCLWSFYCLIFKILMVF